MQVIVATDGSKASLSAAQQFKSFADPAKITEIVIVAVVSPLAVVPFENELSHRTAPGSVDEAVNLSFEAEARGATASLMAEFEGWGPAVSRRLRSGSPGLGDHQGGRGASRRSDRGRRRSSRSHVHHLDRQHGAEAAALRTVPRAGRTASAAPEVRSRLLS